MAEYKEGEQRMKADPKKIFRNPIQIGLICRDLDTTLENFRKILGMEEWRIAPFPPEGHEDVTRVYHEEKEDFTAKFCFFDLGNIEFEIIQPLTGKSVWFDYLDRTPNGLGLHHIKFMADRNEPVKEYFDSIGIPRVTYGEGVGPNAGRTWTFYDTFEKLGFDIEVINRIRGTE